MAPLESREVAGETRDPMRRVRKREGLGEGRGRSRSRSMSRAVLGVALEEASSRRRLVVWVWRAFGE